MSISEAITNRLAELENSEICKNCVNATKVLLPKDSREETFFEVVAYCKLRCINVHGYNSCDDFSRIPVEDTPEED